MSLKIIRGGDDIVQKFHDGDTLKTRLHGACKICNVLFLFSHIQKLTWRINFFDFSSPDIGKLRITIV